MAVERAQARAVPIDMNTLNALKRCSLGLDLYLWLAYRTFALKHQQRITWRQLYRQFGPHPDKASDKNTVKNFRRKNPARTEEDQDCVAGAELLNSSGCIDPLALDSGHRAAQSRSANKLIFLFRPLSGPAAGFEHRVGL